MSKVLKVVAIVAIAVAVVVFAPAIGAALAGIASSIGITVTGAAIASALAGAAISMAVGAIAMAFRKPPNMSNALATRLNRSINPTAPRAIVFGTTAAACDQRHYEVYGKKEDKEAQVIALASHKISRFRAFYMENDLTHNGSYITKHIDGIRSFRVVNEGNSGNAQKLGDGKFWTASSKFTGCAYLAMELNLDPKPWPNGIPTSYRTIVDGCPVYDPRRDSTMGGNGPHRYNDQTTWAFQDGAVQLGRNPALCLLTYLIGWKINGVQVWGMGLPSYHMDMDNFRLFANMCEEQVATQAGGYVQRYTCDGVFTTNDSHETVISGITAAMGSTRLSDRGGTYCLIGGYDDTMGPIIDLGPDDLVAVAGSTQPYSWVPAPRTSESFNIIRGRFADPDNLYQLADWGDPIKTTPLADGIPRTQNLDLGCVSRAETCQRIAKQTLLREAKTPGAFSATFGPRGFCAQVGSLVSLSLPQEGWNKKLFRVLEQAEVHDMFYQMSLREESAEVYAWDKEEKPLPPNIRPPDYDPSMALTPTGFRLSTVTVRSS